MLGSVVWKWKADAYRHATGSSMSKSSPRAAFAEWCHPPPRNSVECGIDHVVLWVSDLERSKRFYIDLLGMTVHHEAIGSRFSGVGRSKWHCSSREMATPSTRASSQPYGNAHGPRKL